MKYAQQGFAAPAIFVIAIVALVGSLGVEGDSGQSVAQTMGLTPEPARQTAFASMETREDETDDTNRK